MPGNSALHVLRGLCPTLSIGVLTADLARLGSGVELLERVGAHLVHFDVMDGCFCPPITFGPPIVKAVKTRLLKDVHLMIDDPLDKVKDFVAAGADIVTVHVESCRHIHRVLQVMGGMTNVNDAERGLIRGVAINPGTPVEALEPLLDDLEMILLLAVNPGWGGQPFIPATKDRIAQVKHMISEAGHDILLAVDGGITRGNVGEVAKTGVDLIVTGSAVFDGKAPEENAKLMLASVEAG